MLSIERQRLLEEVARGRWLRARRGRRRADDGKRSEVFFRARTKWDVFFSIERQRLLEGVARGRWQIIRRGRRRADSQKIIPFVTAIATAILIDFEAVLDRKSIKKSFNMHCESMISFTMKIL